MDDMDIMARVIDTYALDGGCVYDISIECSVMNKRRFIIPVTHLSFILVE